MADNFSPVASATESVSTVSPSSSAFPPSAHPGNVSNVIYSSDSVSLCPQTASAPRFGFAIPNDMLPSIRDEVIHPNLGISPSHAVGLALPKTNKAPIESQLLHSSMSGASVATSCAFSADRFISIPAGVKFAPSTSIDVPWSFIGPFSLVSSVMTKLVTNQFSGISLSPLGTINSEDRYEVLAFPPGSSSVSFCFGPQDSTTSSLPTPYASPLGRLLPSGEEPIAPTQLDPPMQTSPPLVSAHKRRENSSRSGLPGFSSSAKRRHSEISPRTVEAPQPSSPSFASFPVYAGGRRSEALWKASKAAAWSEPNSSRVGRPDPGLSAPRLFALELPFLALFPLAGRSPLFPIGASVASTWKKDVARPLQNLFRINCGLSPHWVRRDGSVDADSCSDSFRLCFCLYRKAAFFASPALLLWWLLARGHASTSLELVQIGDLPRRLSITPQDTPVSLQEAYQSMINHTRRIGGFWHRVWVVASSLLMRHRVPSSPGLQGGARTKVSSGASASSSPPSSPEEVHLVIGPQECCAGDFQCSDCASAPGGAAFVAASTIARAFRRFLHDRTALLSDATASCASAVPPLAFPATALPLSPVSLGLNVCVGSRPLFPPLLLASFAVDRRAGVLSSEPTHTSSVEANYTTASRVSRFSNPWSGDGLRPRNSSFVVSILVHGSVDGVGPLHCALAFVVDDTLPLLVLHHWGHHIALAILLLSAPMVPFSVSWVYDGEPHNTELLAFLHLLLTNRAEAGAPVRIVSLGSELAAPFSPVGSRISAFAYLDICVKPFLIPGMSGGRTWVPWVMSPTLFHSNAQPSSLPFPFLLPIPVAWREGFLPARSASLSSQWPLPYPFLLTDSRLFTPVSWTAAKTQFRQTNAPLELAVWSVAAVDLLCIGLVINQSWAIRWKIILSADTGTSPPDLLEDWASLWVASLFLTTMIGREPDNRRPVLHTRASRTVCGVGAAVSEGMRRSARFYPMGIDWRMAVSPSSHPAVSMACQVATYGFSGSARLSSPALLLEVMLRPSGHPRTRYSSIDTSFEADLNLASDWLLLRDPISSIPSACGCHISTSPDYLVGATSCPLRLSLATYSGSGSDPVGVIVGPNFVWVFSVDKAVMRCIASEPERVAWLYCFLLSVVLSFTSGQVHVCLAAMPCAMPSSPHIGFAEYLLRGLENFNGSITFAICPGLSCSVACRYAQAVLPTFFVAKQFVFEPSRCRYTYMTHGWSSVCARSDSSGLPFVDLCPHIPRAQASLVPHGAADTELYCARLCSSFHLWFVPRAEVPSVSTFLSRQGRGGHRRLPGVRLADGCPRPPDQPFRTIADSEARDSWAFIPPDVLNGLMSGDSNNRAHQRVRRWTSESTQFACFLCGNFSHWFLVVADLGHCTMNIFNSAGTLGNQLAIKHLLPLLMYMGSFEDSIFGSSWGMEERHAVQQQNGYDCGPFTIANCLRIVYSWGLRQVIPLPPMSDFRLRVATLVTSQVQEAYWQGLC